MHRYRENGGNLSFVFLFEPHLISNQTAFQIKKKRLNLPQISTHGIYLNFNACNVKNFSFYYNDIGNPSSCLKKFIESSFNFLDCSWNSVLNL